MDRGTVIKACGNRAFVMNERCEFVEVRTAAVLQPGDSIEYSPGDLIRPGKYPVKGLALVASFILVCLIAFGAFKSMFINRAYAYVGLDINPSIEIGIDSGLRVVSLTGFNDEGNKIIKSHRLLDSGIDEALKIIIQDCRASNYLSVENKNSIAVSVHTPGGTGSRDLMERLSGTIGAELTANGISARTYFFGIGKNTWEEARKKEVSAVKYLLWEEAVRHGYSPRLQEVSLNDPRINSLAGGLEEKISGPFFAAGANGEVPPEKGPVGHQVEKQAISPPGRDQRPAGRPEPETERYDGGQNAVKRNESKAEPPSGGREAPKADPEDGQRGSDGLIRPEAGNQGKKDTAEKEQDILRPDVSPGTDGKGIDVKQDVDPAAGQGDSAGTGRTDAGGGGSGGSKGGSGGSKGRK